MAYSWSTILISFNTWIGIVALFAITEIIFDVVSEIKVKIYTHSQSSSIPSANPGTVRKLKRNYQYLAPPIDFPPIQEPRAQVEEVKISELNRFNREERKEYFKIVDHTQIQVQVTQSSHFVSNELFVWTTSDQRGNECSSPEILCMSSTKTASSIGWERIRADRFEGLD